MVGPLFYYTEEDTGTPTEPVRGRGKHTATSLHRTPREIVTRPATLGLCGSRDRGRTSADGLAATKSGGVKPSRSHPPSGTGVAAEWKGRARGRPEHGPQPRSSRPATFPALLRLPAAHSDASTRSRRGDHWDS